MSKHISKKYNSGYIALVLVITLSLASLGVVSNLQGSFVNLNRILREYVSMRNRFEDVHLCAIGFMRKVYADIGYTFDSVEYIGEQRCSFTYLKKDSFGVSVRILSEDEDRVGLIDTSKSRFVYNISYDIQDTLSTSTHYFISNIRILLSII